MRAGAVGLILVFVLIGTGLAEEEDGAPLTASEAAERAREAYREGDETALARLATQPIPGPWVIADSLCFLEAYEAADALARAAPSKDVEALPAYVAARKAEGNPEDLRETFYRAIRTSQQGSFADTLALLAGATSDDSLWIALLEKVRGMAFARLGRHEEAARHLAQGAAAAERIGWLRQAGETRFYQGVTAYHAGTFDAALEAWSRCAEVERKRNAPASLAKALHLIGSVHVEQGRAEAAIEPLQGALELRVASGDKREEARTRAYLARAYGALGRHGEVRTQYTRAVILFRDIGDSTGEASILARLGRLCKSQGRYLEASKHLARALRIYEALGRQGGVLSTLVDLGSILLRQGNPDAAHEHFVRALDIATRTGNREGIAAILGNLGNVFGHRGQYDKALEHLDRSLRAKQLLGDQSGIANTLGNIGSVHAERGDYPKAEAYFRQALDLAEKLGERALAARQLANLGNIYDRLAEFEKSRAAYRRALVMRQDLGNPAAVAAVLGGLANTLESEGRYAEALEYYLRAMPVEEQAGVRRDLGHTLGNVAAVYFHLGDEEQARAYMDRALRLQEEIGDQAGLADTLVKLGVLSGSRGAYDRSRMLLGRALEIYGARQDRRGEAHCLVHLGHTYQEAGDHAAALERLDEALTLLQSLKDPETEASCRMNRGVSLASLDRTTEARAETERALEIAEASGVTDVAIGTRSNLGYLDLEEGRPQATIAALRRAIGDLTTLSRGLGDEQGALLRDRWMRLYVGGLKASLALDDVEEALYFLESGRAGVLRETLGGRGALLAAVVPEKLRGLEAQARAAERVARGRARRARDAGKLAEYRTRRAELAEARGQLADVVQRTQRTVRMAADLVYCQPASLADLRAEIEPGDALVLYDVVSEEACAIVVERRSARIVKLGDGEAVQTACAELDLCDATAKPEGALEALRACLVEPLALDDATRRVLVSPQGPLAYVPFALLLGERDVAYVPSGTTYQLLRREPGAGGEGVLALGDPDYGVRPATSTVALLRSGQLEALPGTRTEAKAIGDVVLLGPEATPEGLQEALADRKRWRAVHLACHGLVSRERPMLSALALTGDYLTAADVLRLRVPTDLAVLSACRTATGKLYQSEGVVGLTRAFMFAGAPRVIVSLWDVDDEATRDLMQHFYARWKTGEVSTATALREAQAHVASQERWRHPYYWAAWQLWGRAD